MAANRRIVIATHNGNKTAEFAQLLGEGFELSDLTTAAVPFTKVEETGSTFEENAAIKALAASRLTTDVVVGDDSGLEVDALDGAPGIYSARYAGKQADDAANVAKLLRDLRAQNDPSRKARFRCVLAVARGGKLLPTFDGTLEGNIATVPRGESGFGYDPIFLPDGFSETLAELGPAVKNRISHRARAAAALKRALEENAFG